MRQSAWLMSVLTAFLLQTSATLLDAQGSAGSQRRASLIGCVQRAGARYTLKDSRSGVVHPVLGDSAVLDYHVGHTVELVGVFQGSGDNPPFQIESVAYISPTCK